MLAGLWAGHLLCVAGVAAPSAFAVLERTQAGHYVGRLFSLDAQISLAAALLLVMMERRLQSDSGVARVLTPDLLLPLAALLFTVAGYYGLQPLMEAARAGQGALSFGALHGLSTLFFAAKSLCVLALAWRVLRR